MIPFAAYTAAKTPNVFSVLATPKNCPFSWRTSISV